MKIIKLFYLLGGVIGLHSCNGQNLPSKAQQVQNYYKLNCGNKRSSVSTGSVINGELINGKLIPFYGPNFNYFDTTSYLSGRAFLNDKVLNTLLSSYDFLYAINPNRKYQIMEAALKNGGEIKPHRTHRNGMSIDLMMPKLKNNEPYYGLDTLGSQHYFLNFKDDGTWQNDPSICIDFEAIAQHLLVLDSIAKKSGLKIAKVIVKLEYHDLLFSGYFGKKLKAKNIYFAQRLPNIINALHDEHYHVDFEPIN